MMILYSNNKKNNQNNIHSNYFIGINAQSEITIPVKTNNNKSYMDNRYIIEHIEKHYQFIKRVGYKYFSIKDVISLNTLLDQQIDILLDNILNLCTTDFDKNKKFYENQEKTKLNNNIIYYLMQFNNNINKSIINTSIMDNILNDSRFDKINILNFINKKNFDKVITKDINNKDIINKNSLEEYERNTYDNIINEIPSIYSKQFLFLLRFGFLVGAIIDAPVIIDDIVKNYRNNKFIIYVHSIFSPSIHFGPNIDILEYFNDINISIGTFINNYISIILNVNINTLLYLHKMITNDQILFIVSLLGLCFILNIFKFKIMLVVTFNFLYQCIIVSLFIIYVFITYPIKSKILNNIFNKNQLEIK